MNESPQPPPPATETPSLTPETDAIILQLWGVMESSPIPNRIRNFARTLELARNAALSDLAAARTDAMRLEAERDNSELRRSKLFEVSKKLLMSSAELKREIDQLRADLSTMTADRDAARAEAVRLQADAVVMREALSAGDSALDKMFWTSDDGRLIRDGTPDDQDAPINVCEAWQRMRAAISPNPGAPLLSAFEALAVALERQHAWHLDQTDRTPVYFGDTIGQVDADEYGDSELYSETDNAIDLARPFRAALSGQPIDDHQGHE